MVQSGSLPASVTSGAGDLCLAASIFPLTYELLETVGLLYQEERFRQSFEIRNVYTSCERSPRALAAARNIPVPRCAYRRYFTYENGSKEGELAIDLRRASES
ncbi:hypothetical protein BHE90_009812 [Fusarium euwallaceae]|uniref:Uncharacterized protein n=1 Tax=Fusarium euwallaceae TaxID=1147111 RepID=A0A430LJ67_9HYPO|nr:hypothetical protein BHE90_009812 [Fusarium euwallaceae]